MRIDDEIYVHGYLDEIRQDKVIIRNEGGYFGTVADELVEVIPKVEYEARLKADMIAMLEEIKLKIKGKSYHDTMIIGNYEDEVRTELVELDDVNEIIQDKINTLEVENGNDNITSPTKAT